MPEARPSPVLIVHGGLAGTGKSTTGRALGARIEAVYLRIDRREQALRSAPRLDEAVGSLGHVVAQATLELGRTVVSDSVNPNGQTCDAWLEMEARARACLLELERPRSDPEVRRNWSEERTGDIEGLRLLTSQRVVRRAYEP